MNNILETGIGPLLTMLSGKPLGLHTDPVNKLMPCGWLSIRALQVSGLRLRFLSTFPCLNAYDSLLRLTVYALTKLCRNRYYHRCPLTLSLFSECKDLKTDLESAAEQHLNV